MKAKNLFSDKLKLREFTARSIVVKELLKEVFQEKEKWQRKTRINTKSTEVVKMMANDSPSWWLLLAKDSHFLSGFPSLGQPSQWLSVQELNSLIPFPSEKYCRTILVLELWNCFKTVCFLSLFSFTFIKKNF